MDGRSVCSMLVLKAPSSAESNPIMNRKLLCHEAAERKQSVLSSSMVEPSSKRKCSGYSKSPSSLKFKCPNPVCIYSTSHKSNLLRHVKAMHTSQKGVKECCGYVFYSRRHYQIHLKADHLNGYMCKLCKKCFKRRSMLSRHNDAIHGSVPHAHQCHKCPYSTSHKSNLKRHCMLKHKEPIIMNLTLKTLQCRNAQIWRPVPEIFSHENETDESTKEITMEQIASEMKRPRSNISYSSGLILHLESNTHERPLSGIAHNSNATASQILPNNQVLNGAYSEYFHKKLRWNMYFQ